MNAIHVRIPVRTRNPNNGQQGNSRVAGILKAKERKAQREAARLHTLAALPRGWLQNAFQCAEATRVASGSCERDTGQPGAIVVSVVRVAPSNGLDPHDGLGAALKGCIDGIADALGLRNDRDPRVRWCLGQRRGKPKEYAVEVTLEVGQ